MNQTTKEISHCAKERINSFLTLDFTFKAFFSSITSLEFVTVLVVEDVVDGSEELALLEARKDDASGGRNEEDS